MLIGILADSHDHVGRIKLAIRMLGERGITTVIHAGDFVAPFALVPFVEANLKLHAVFGNNDGEIRGLRQKADPIGGIQAGPYRFVIEGKKFLVNHAPLCDEKIALERHRTDFLIYGHTHIADHHRVDKMAVINPGELCGWLKGRATFAILNTDTAACEFIDL